MRRFFYATPNTLMVHQNFTLTDEIYHHWCKVLRAKVGDTAILFDGNGGEYQATLTDINKKSAQVFIEHFSPINRTSPFDVTVGLVVSRGERMDYALQKATETGVSHIQLLTSQHGEVHIKGEQLAKKMAHWQGVVVSACEQCGLNIVPKISQPIALTDWVTHDFDNNRLKLILAVPNNIDNKKSSILQKIQQYFKQQLSINQKPHIILLIGAEGGLSIDEIDLSLQQNFLAWQIGERILRTETAPVVALSALLTLYEVCLHN